MEGPLIVIKAWALAAFGVWLYRRFFERVAKAEPEFEAWCRGGVLLAALRGNAAGLALVERQLREQLGKRSRAVATLGGWPWPNYALELQLVAKHRMLELRVVRAQLLRAQREPPKALVGLLREVMNEYPNAVDDAWLHSGTVYGKSGPDAAPGGWRLHAGSEPRPRLDAREHSPSWLPTEPRQVSEAAQKTEQDAAAPQKLHVFEGAE